MSPAFPEEEVAAAATAHVRAEVESALALVTSCDTDRRVYTFLQRIYTSYSRRNQIHPLFAWQQWSNLTQKQYLAILPALALASRMLTLPLTTNYINALIYSPTTIKCDTLGKPRKHFRWLCADPQQPLPAEAQKRYDEALLRLLPHVRLGRARLGAGTCGVTGPTKKKNKIEGQPSGLQSIIYISEEHIDDVMPGERKKEERKNLRQLLLCYRELAQTLVHELMHSIGFSLRGDKDGEAFFENYKFVEIGFAFEVAATGGLMTIPNEVRGTRDVTLEVRELDVPGAIKCYGTRKISFPISSPIRSPGEFRGKHIRDVDWREVMAEFEELMGSEESVSIPESR